VTETRRDDSSGEEREVQVVHGACRAAVGLFPESRLDLLRALSLIAVDAFQQRPGAWNLLGLADAVLFEDDVLEVSGEWTASFSFDLDESVTAGPPFCLHVSFRDQISNILWVD